MSDDRYETRKAEFGELVSRFHFNFNLPSSGYRMERGFFPPHKMEELRAIAVNGQFPSGVLLSTEPESNAIRTALGVHLADPFAAVCMDERLRIEAVHILGGDCYVHQSRINFKFAGVGSGWSWHSDFETWHAQDGMPTPQCVTAMIPLEKNTAENGPLIVIPGSHTLYWSAPRSAHEYSALENWADQKEGVPSPAVIDEIKYKVGGREQRILCEPGDVLFFDCNLMHSSAPNLSPQSRANMFVVFNRRDNALRAPYSASVPRPIQMGYREGGV